jgi:hypothetical protein
MCDARLRSSIWAQRGCSWSTGGPACKIKGSFEVWFCAAAQFYLGTTRLQLEHKGDAAHVVTDLANIVPAFGFVGIPIIGWLLDKQVRMRASFSAHAHFPHMPFAHAQDFLHMPSCLLALAWPACSARCMHGPALF